MLPHIMTIGYGNGGYAPLLWSDDFNATLRRAVMDVLMTSTFSPTSGGLVVRPLPGDGGLGVVAGARFVPDATGRGHWEHAVAVGTLDEIGARSLTSLIEDLPEFPTTQHGAWIWGESRQPPPHHLLAREAWARLMAGEPAALVGLPAGDQRTVVEVARAALPAPVRARLSFVLGLSDDPSSDAAPGLLAGERASFASRVILTPDTERTSTPYTAWFDGNVVDGRVSPWPPVRGDDLNTLLSASRAAILAGVAASRLLAGQSTGSLNDLLRQPGPAQRLAEVFADAPAASRAHAGGRLAMDGGGTATEPDATAWLAATLMLDGWAEMLQAADANSPWAFHSPPSEASESTQAAYTALRLRVLQRVFHHDPARAAELLDRPILAPEPAPPTRSRLWSWGASPAAPPPDSLRSRLLGPEVRTTPSDLPPMTQRLRHADALVRSPRGAGTQMHQRLAASMDVGHIGWWLERVHAQLLRRGSAGIAAWEAQQLARSVPKAPAADGR